MKDKVWNFEYIDLSLFLTQNFLQIEDDRPCNIEVLNGKLVFQQKPKKVKYIDNIKLWTDAFINYSQVLLENHPGKALDLFKYMSLIRSIAYEHPNAKWIQYDQQFRLRISRNPSRLWSSIDGDLWLKYILSPSTGNNVPNARFCYEFNYRGRCMKRVCYYKHACLKCQQQHPSIYCRTSGNLGNRVNIYGNQSNGNGRAQPQNRVNAGFGDLQKPKQPISSSRYSTK